MTDIITKYFPQLNADQLSQFEKLNELYRYWNSQINVISRKDLDLLYERHVLHSLGIAKVITFRPSTRILDVGTGGGFPGIPLAILYPQSDFLLVDSIGKKIKVVREVSDSLGLGNVRTAHTRAEDVAEKFHFVVSRAVTEFPAFYKWVKDKFMKENFNDLPNGILYLKGGDLRGEFGTYYSRAQFFELKEFFEEEFFETKKVVYYPAR